jgi:hypothetical protein
MTYSVSTAFVNQYSDQIKLLASQRHSVFENLVTQGDSSGEYKYFDYIGPVSFAARTASNEATSFTDVDHTKRVVSFTDYTVNFYKDNVVDMQRMIADPQGPYIQAAVNAWNEKKDTIVASAFFGSATTGKGVGASFGSQAFLTSTQTVDVNYVDGNPIGAGNGTGTYSATTALFSYAKFVKARSVLLANNAVTPGQLIKLAVDPEDEAVILGLTEFRNRDYSSEKLVADKMIDTTGLIGIWFGVAIYRTNALTITDPASASNQYRSLPMWVEDGMGMVKGGSPTVTVMQNPERNMAYTINVQGSCGAVRLEEKKVVEIRVRTGTDAS